MGGIPIVGDLFSGPKTPPAPAPVAPATRTGDDRASETAARERQVRAAAVGRGRGATVLTSELGVTDRSQQRRRTLGAA